MAFPKKNVFILWCSFLIASNVAAKELPLWEFGLGFGGLHQSYYTGTEQTRGYAFPVILPIYRGDLIKSDDKGLRAELFKDDRYKLDFSLDFSFAVESDDIDLRQGMPDIGSLIELGPSFEVRFFETENEKWFLRLPLRTVTEIDDSEFNSAGFNFSPNIALEKRFESTSWKLGASLAAQFGDRDYNSIYYSVAPAFATVDRPAYEASSGYAGARLQIAMTSRTPKNLLVLFLRYDNIKGAVYDDSPLVETNHNVTVGFIYSRHLMQSKRTVSRDEW